MGGPVGQAPERAKAAGGRPRFLARSADAAGRPCAPLQFLASGGTTTSVVELLRYGRRSIRSQAHYRQRGARLAFPRTLRDRRAG